MQHTHPRAMETSHTLDRYCILTMDSSVTVTRSLFKNVLSEMDDLAEIGKANF